MVFLNRAIKCESIRYSIELVANETGKERTPVKVLEEAMRNGVGEGTEIIQASRSQTHGTRYQS